MGKVYERIDERLADWVASQALFFVGTAPLGADGHVNVSPKGPIGSLQVLDETTVAYLDAIGSGAETIAHLRENGRIVVMLCAFAGPPRIVRFHGRGEVVTADDPRFADLVGSRPFDDPGAPEARRALVVVHVERIADSCGYGVPVMAYEKRRTQLDTWAAKKLESGGKAALLEYQRRNNTLSIDGLPALDTP